MQGWGVWLILLGVGSFILPMFGRQFILISIFGPAAPVVSVLFIVGGIVMLVVGRSRNS